MKLTIPALAAVVIAVAGCTASLSSSSAPAVTTQPAATSAPAVHGNISIAPADGMTAGPMRITPLYCGKFTAAQQSRYGTTAAGGLLYRYENQGNLAGAPQVDVSFTNGATVAGENVSGDLTNIGPGQSATGEVDAVGGSGQDLSFTGCEIDYYTLAVSNGTAAGRYAG